MGSAFSASTVVQASLRGSLKEILKTFPKSGVSYKEELASLRLQHANLHLCFRRKKEIAQKAAEENERYRKEMEQ